MTNSDDREIDFFNFLTNEKGLDPIGASDTISEVSNYARPRLAENPDLTNEEVYNDWEEFVQDMDDFYDSEEFKHGVELGKALESYDQYLEVKRAYEMGEIELWLEYYEP